MASLATLHPPLHLASLLQLADLPRTVLPPRFPVEQLALVPSVLTHSPSPTHRRDDRVQVYDADSVDIAWPNHHS
jgi:hypothetical protein